LKQQISDSWAAQRQRTGFERRQTGLFQFQRR
jgi:hypothetical protein